MPARSRRAAAQMMRCPNIRRWPNHYPGAEARVRYGLLLDKAGRQSEARNVLNEFLTQFKRAPKYVRRAQAEWIALAEKAVRHNAPPQACGEAIPAALISGNFSTWIGAPSSGSAGM